MACEEPCCTKKPWKYEYEVVGCVQEGESEVQTLGEGGLFFYKDGSINDIISCMNTFDEEGCIERTIKITVEVTDDSDC